jgi:hypothetical protein
MTIRRIVTAGSYLVIGCSTAVADTNRFFDCELTQENEYWSKFPEHDYSGPCQSRCHLKLSLANLHRGADKYTSDKSGSMSGSDWTRQISISRSDGSVRLTDVVTFPKNGTVTSVKTGMCALKTETLKF